MESIVASKRGIPAMDVVEDVEAFLKTEKQSVEEAVKFFEERYQKYKSMEGGLVSQKVRMMGKLPEFKNSLQLIDILLDKREKGESFEVTHQLAEEVYTKAVVEKPDKVAIWYGANIMVEHDLAGAKAMIEKNQINAEKIIDELTTELDFLKDQITTTEVNMAHVHNYTVKQRQATMAMAANS